MKRKFKIGSTFYEIPDSEVGSFLKDNPSAIEVKHYALNGQKYNIPLGEVDAFETEMGLKKKEEPAFSASGSVSVGGGTDPIPQSTSPSGSEKSESSEMGIGMSPLAFTSDADNTAAPVTTTKPADKTSQPSSQPTQPAKSNAELVTEYVRGLRDPKEVAANSTVTDYQATAIINKSNPLVQVKKDGTKNLTKQQAIDKQIEDKRNIRLNRIDEIKQGLYNGTATMKEFQELAGYEEAQDLVRNHLQGFSDPADRPVDIMAPGKHWESAWKNSTAEFRPLAVQNLNQTEKQLDQQLLGLEGSVLNWTETNQAIASPVSVFPGGLGGNIDQPFVTSVPKIDLTSSEQLSEIFHAVSRSKGIKDVSGNDVAGKKEQFLAALDFKIKQLERQKPISEEINELDSQINGAVGEIISRHEQIQSDNNYRVIGDRHEKTTPIIKRGLNYMKSFDPVKYGNITKALRDKGEIAESDYSQLLSVGQQLENMNTFVNAATNKDLIGAETDFSPETKSSLIAKRSGILGETAKRLGFKNKIEFDNDEIETLVKNTDWEAAGMKAPSQNEIDHIKLKENQWFFDQIPKTGAGAAFIRGVEKPFLGIARTVEDLASGSTSADYLRSASTDRRTLGEQLTPDEKGQLGSGVASDRGNMWYTVMEGAGSFLPQILLTKGLGAPASLAARGAVASAAPRAALTAEQLFAINTATGTLLSSYLQSYGDAYELGLQKTGDPVKAEAMGVVGGIIDGVMEQWLPEVKIGRNIMRNMKGNVSEKIINLARKGADPQDLIKQTQSILKPFVTEYLNVTKQEMAEEGTAVLLKQLAETIISPSTAATNDVMSELGETLWSTALQTFLPAVGSGGAASRNRFTTKMFNDAAINFDYSLDAMKKSLLNGTVTQSDYNSAVQLLSTHAESINRSPKQDENGKDLTNKQRLDYAYEDTRIKINKENAKNQDGVQKELTEKRIKESEEVQRSILMPKPLEEATTEIQPAETAFTEGAAPVELTQQEKAAIDGLVGQDFAGSIVTPYTDVIQNPEATPQEKKEALKGLSDQLTAPGTEGDVGLALGRRADLIYDLGYPAAEESQAIQDVAAAGPTAITNPALLAAMQREGIIQQPNQEQALTPEETTEWADLSLAQKRELAVANLEEVTEDTDQQEIIDLADTNAKYLLAKLHGEDISRPIELNPNITTPQNTGGQNAIQEQEAKVVSEKLNKGDSFWSVISPQTKKSVETGVLAALHDEEVIRRIIPLIPVDMVNYFGRQNIPLEDALRDLRVFSDGASAVGMSYVPVRVYKEAMAFARTKQSVLPEIAGRDVEAIAALDAILINAPDGSITSGEFDSTRNAAKKVSTSTSGVEQTATELAGDVRVSSHNNENSEVAEENQLKSFVDRLTTGQDLTSPEDLQYYENNRAAIEQSLRDRFEEENESEVDEDGVTEEDRTKISDALFAFADKILKADITGSGGGAAMSNILAIPQQVIGRSIQAVAAAVKAGETIAAAIQKGIQVIRDSGHSVDTDEYTGFAKSLIAGQKPKIRVRPTAERVGPDTQQEKQSQESGEYNFGEREFTPGNDPISKFVIRTIDVERAFGTDLTMQIKWNETPSDEKFRVQMGMLSDGKEMIGLAQTMFGGTNINVYGPQLFSYIKSMPQDGTNKKAVLMATFLGELKNAMLGKPSDDIRRLYSVASVHYRNFMHQTAKNLVAGRLLALYRDKYMADIYQDVIMEEQQIRDSKKAKDAEAETTVKDEDVQDFNTAKQKGRSKKDVDADIKNANETRKNDKKTAEQRKPSKKEFYKKAAEDKTEEIKKKYGGKNALLDQIIDKINKLNCK